MKTILLLICLFFLSSCAYFDGKKRYAFTPEQVLVIYQNAYFQGANASRLQKPILESWKVDSLEVLTKLLKDLQ